MSANPYESPKTRCRRRIAATPGFLLAAAVGLVVACLAALAGYFVGYYDGYGLGNSDRTEAYGVIETPSTILPHDAYR